MVATICNRGRVRYNPTKELKYSMQNMTALARIIDVIKKKKCRSCANTVRKNIQNMTTSHGAVSACVLCADVDRDLSLVLLSDVHRTEKRCCMCFKPKPNFV